LLKGSKCITYPDNYCTEGSKMEPMELYAQNPEQLKAGCHQGATVARVAAALAGKDLLAHSNEAPRREPAKQFLDIQPPSLYNSVKC
jgi:hypothetical protein